MPPYCHVTTASLPRRCHGTDPLLVYDARDNFFLVNVVDNDFVGGDIFSVFDEVTAAADARRLRKETRQQLKGPHGEGASSSDDFF